jgi:hypothetical protein
MIRLHAKSQSELNYAYKMILIGGIAGVALLFFNWVFGGWFLKTLFGGHIGNFWSPGKIIYVSEGILLGILLGLVGLLGLGLSTIVEHLIVKDHTGSSPVINPPSMIPGFIGLAAFVGGIVLVLRYLFIFALIGYYAIIGTKINFHANVNDMKVDARRVVDGEITRSKADSLHFGFVDPDTLNKIFDRLYTGKMFYKGPTTINAGDLIKGDLGANWTKYPVKVLAISYDGRKGLFESTGSFQISDFMNAAGSYWKIVADINPVVDQSSIDFAIRNIIYYWPSGLSDSQPEQFTFKHEHSFINDALGYNLTFNFGPQIELDITGGWVSGDIDCTGPRSEPVMVHGQAGCFLYSAQGYHNVEWKENNIPYAVGGDKHVSNEFVLDVAEHLHPISLSDLQARMK